MVIEPMRHHDGRAYTNVELIKIFGQKLEDIRLGKGATNAAEKKAMENAYYKICGGSKYANEISEYLNQFIELDEKTGQQLFVDSLMPIER